MFTTIFYETNVTITKPPWSPPESLQEASKVNRFTKKITYLKKYGFKEIVIKNHQWDVDKKDKRLLTDLSELYTNFLANFPCLEPTVD